MAKRRTTQADREAMKQFQKDFAAHMKAELAFQEMILGVFIGRKKART